MPDRVEIFGLPGVPMVQPGDDLAALAISALVDAAIAAGAGIYVQPTVTFVYAPDASTSEDTPIHQALAWGRLLRIGDGPDEVHLRQIFRMEAMPTWSIADSPYLAAHPA